MIYQTVLKIRGKEVPILYYNYRCHVRHCDDPNLWRIIQYHIQVCEEIGNREYLPVDGDLITLAFECKGDEQFFYDWMNEGAMHDGEIHFIYNEVEIADIFRFWDCYCVKIEEYMSVGNAPMMMVVYLSPGIIKRNNLEVREKVWKVSEIVFIPIVEHIYNKKMQIIDAYWIDENGEEQRSLDIEYPVTLYIKLENFAQGKEVSFTFNDNERKMKKSKCSGIIDSDGIVTIEEFKIELNNNGYKEE